MIVRHHPLYRTFKSSKQNGEDKAAEIQHTQKMEMLPKSKTWFTGDYVMMQDKMLDKSDSPLYPQLIRLCLESALELNEARTITKVASDIFLWVTVIGKAVRIMRKNLKWLVMSAPHTHKNVKKLSEEKPILLKQDHYEMKAYYVERPETNNLILSCSDREA